jgi:hypothetical protein
VTRQRLKNAIRAKLKDYQLPVSDEAREVSDVAVDCALEYVLRFAQEVSQELTSKHLYSEAMTAGVFIKKLKDLLGENND